MAKHRFMTLKLLYKQRNFEIMANQKIKEQDVIDTIYGLGIFAMMVILVIGMFCYCYQEHKKSKEINCKTLNK